MLLINMLTFSEIIIFFKGVKYILMMPLIASDPSVWPDCNIQDGGPGQAGCLQRYKFRV